MYIEAYMTTGSERDTYKTTIRLSVRDVYQNFHDKIDLFNFFQGNFFICFLPIYGSDVMNLRKIIRLLFLFRGKPFFVDTCFLINLQST